MKLFQNKGNERDVVISSRVRFARNIAGYPFPGRLTKEQSDEIIDKVKSALGKDFEYTDFAKLSPIESRAYVERHEVSPEFAEVKGPHGLFTNTEKGLGVMVCEEDHIRLQSIYAGLSLKEAYAAACEADDLLDASLDIAFDGKLGYLTHCPTNLGTGMRASVMMFLPAMTMYRHIGRLSSQLQKIGLTVRGLFGEGSDADGCIYQISNQITLGITEEETLGKLSDVVNQIVSEEKKLRAELSKNEKLCDRIARAEGTLRYARIISTSEFMSLYSDLRLGIATGLTSSVDYRTLDSLLFEIMPANITLSKGAKELSETERDRARAEIIRKSFD